MSRPLRIEFPGAVYHLTSRGDRREPIFVDDEDRETLLAIVAHALDRFDAVALAYCLMGNHYHFALHTRAANLSRLMRHINGVYTQAYNRRHGLVGHLFQGRFKAVLVDTESYLLEVCRYVDLNPVRAQMVRAPDRWPWSSYAAHAGLRAPEPWLDTLGVWQQLTGRDVTTTAQAQRAAARYRQLVADGIGVPLWETALRQQIFLGDEAFVARMQEMAEPQRKASKAVPKAQRSAPPSARPRTWAQWLKACGSRDQALASAYREGGWTMARLAEQSGLSLSHVSRLIAGAEGRQPLEPLAQHLPRPSA
jgi:putative transposase